jgi:hypothetical protein
MPGFSLPEMLVPQHGLTRYIRVGLSVEDGIMIWRRPRRILGVIPFGRHVIRIPVEDVESMRIRDLSVRWWRLPIPVAIVVAAALLTPWQLMVPLILFGAWTGFVSFGPYLEAATRDGTAHRVAVCFGHRIDAELFIEAVTGEPVAA